MKIGQTVIIRYPTGFNGSHEHPAIVNRVWNDGAHLGADGVGMVNTTMFPDCAQPMSVTSVGVFKSREAAMASPYASSQVAWLAE